MGQLPRGAARTLARSLYEARATRQPIAPLTDAEPGLGPLDGYAIQRELLSLLQADGERVSGYKAGLTSEPMQAMFGLDSPDYGPVLASTVHRSGSALSLKAFTAPRVEAEIACRLGADLTGPGITVQQARRSITEVYASIEIVDSRIRDWRIRLADTIADLASAGAVVIGDLPVPAAGLDLPGIAMHLRRGDEWIAAGKGSAALGDPAAVVAWLANTLGALGVTLEAGHLVMTGALHAAVPMSAGDEFVAEFDVLGSVGMRVEP
ncbi:fumarylacetoacetate hydrolase family protein [Actinoplanes sp. NPDC051851]|uniref:2-keto-4-pentenoate hydratase n=1 Tax=Actinoplanes sp. NPDC051851 TaxID=3154753 RepID=UPI003415662D